MLNNLLCVQTHENLEHLAMMETVLGAIPESLGRRASRDAEKYFRWAHSLSGFWSNACDCNPFPHTRELTTLSPFRRRGKLAWPEAASSRKSVRAVQRLAGLQKHISASCDASLKPLLQPLVS